MQLLWIILRWLFPNDPVRQSIEAARGDIAMIVRQVFEEKTLAELMQHRETRINLEAFINNFHAALHAIIGDRACQIAGLPIPAAEHRPRYAPTRDRPLEVLLARLGDLVTMADNIERLAQIRAERLKREHHAGPLKLNDHSHLIARLSHRSSRRKSGSRADAETCSGLQLQGCSRLTTVPGSRLSSGRSGMDCVLTLARGPPPTIVQHHPQSASQAHLRERGPVPRPDNSRARPPFAPIHAAPWPHSPATS